VTRVLKAGQVLSVKHEAATRAAAEIEVEREREAALAEAYAHGLADGRAAAVRDGADAAPRGAAALERLLQVASQQRQRELDAGSRAVLAAAIDIAEWILRHELSADTRSLLSRLDAAAHALMPGGDARVTVSVADEPAVRGWATRHDVEVVVDPALSPGDARFDNGAGHVDVTVSVALRVAAEALGVDPARGPQ
jgi:flagellar biosynthesis/type III secretory pathway protein FliH